MKLRGLAILGTAVLAFGLVIGCSSSEPEGAMEEAGAAVDSAVDEVQDGMESAGEAVEGAVEGASEEVEGTVEEVTQD